MKYDDAAWHVGGAFPTDLPHSAGATHIGMFVAWGALNGLAGEVFTTDFAAALEELRSQHEDQLNNVQAEAHLAHTKDVESLKSNHASEISKTVADVHAAHARELDTLRSNHADEVGKAIASTQSAYE